MNKDDKLGKRFNNGKLKMSLLLETGEALDGAIKCLMHGEKKYGRNNWKKGLKYTEIIDSLLRHLNQFMRGQDVDLESNSEYNHVDAIVVNALFLSYMFYKRKDLDDRGKE